MEPSPTGGLDPLDPLAALAEPVRRRLYEVVVAAGVAVDRDDAAAGAGIARPLAAFHLDRLAEAGLLAVEYRRRNGKVGPGAGRPAKFYRRASGPDIAVSLPPRDYSLAARILADAADRRDDGRTQVLEAAAAEGARIAGDAAPRSREALLALLGRQGYEPVEEPDGVIRLRNCPFHALVADHLELTCSMNLALLEGVLATSTGTGVTAASQPRPGCCCVAFIPETPPA
jgi:predicted ArsR family transcriptional regulator